MSAEHGNMVKIYMFIFVALVVLTGATVGASDIDLGRTGNIIVGLIIASCKACLVALFFMHLKYDERALLAVALFPVLLVLVLVFAMMSDVGTNFQPPPDLGHTAQPK